MVKIFTRLLVIIGLSTWFSVAADGMDSARTNLIKAGMINGFASYTTWPTNDPASPFVIGVMGHDQYFIPALQRFFNRKPLANGRTLQIIAVNVSEVTKCQMVILLGDANQQAALVLAKVAKLPILTISDQQGFADAGGHVNFFNENNRLRFAINWNNAIDSQLKLSSRLLQLAKVVDNVVDQPQ